MRGLPSRNDRRRRPFPCSGGRTISCGRRSHGAEPRRGRAIEASRAPIDEGSPSPPALPQPDDEAFGSVFDGFGDARVVLLGEATHGTSEFYKARAAITRCLVTRHGFGIVAVEADWPDAARIDAYVRHHQPRPGREEAFTRFP